MTRQGMAWVRIRVTTIRLIQIGTVLLPILIAACDPNGGGGGGNGY